MGKKGGGNSWLTVVKRAFRSPTKDSKKKSSRGRDEFDGVHEEEEEEEEKKREKKRWLFRKSSKNNNNNGSACNCAPETPPQGDAKAMKKSSPTLQKGHAAAVDIIRLTHRSSSNSPTSAATIIQTAFRAYVARRAFCALKGIVKLQALIRGQNVRKQAKMTLKCMQALLRVQARLRDQQARLLSHHHHHAAWGGRKSMFAECNNLWESRYLGEVRERKSMSTKNRSSIAEEYYCPRTLEDLQAALQATKEAAALKRDRKSLASAFSLHHHHQTWGDKDYDINSGYEKEEEEEEEEERTKWLDKWMATKQWDNCNYTRIGSTDNYNKRDHHSSIKTVEMVETPIPNQHSHQRPTTPNNNYRSFYNNNYYNPAPSPSKKKLLPGQNVGRSSSPRRTPNKEERSYYYSTAANTPTSTGSLRSSLQRLNGNNNLCRRYSVSTNTEGRTGFNTNDFGPLMLPSYMAATESAKARVRSQSAPRQRPSTPERDYQQRGGGSSGGLAKKRLSFPVAPATTGATGIINHQNLRSPSFKSLQAGYVGMEQQSNQSFYSTTDSFGGGEISPCSTTDMRRWLR